MTVRVYRSTDASAPVLTGQVGKLTDLLDAVLVNGYGAQTAAGWTINQTTTNKRGYKQNLTGSNNSSGMLLYVDDTGPGAGAAKEARACGFETMSAITPTGTGQFPTSAQSAVGVGTLVVRKSATADATARPWTIVANGQTVYIFIETGDITAPQLATMPFVFGDFKSYKTSDQYAVCIIGRTAENSASANIDPLSAVGAADNVIMNLNNVLIGHYIARHWTAVGSSVRAGKVLTAVPQIDPRGSYGPWSSDVNTTLGASFNGIGRISSTPVGLPFPNGPDGSLWLAPIYLNHSWAIRGYLAGLWAPLHDRPLAHNDTLTAASGTLSGKSFVAQNIAFFNSVSVSENGQILAETSDTWT